MFIQSRVLVAAGNPSQLLLADPQVFGCSTESLQWLLGPSHGLLPVQRAATWRRPGGILPRFLNHPNLSFGGKEAAALLPAFKYSSPCLWAWALMWNLKFHGGFTSPQLTSPAVVHVALWFWFFHVLLMCFRQLCYSALWFVKAGWYSTESASRQWRNILIKLLLRETSQAHNWVFHAAIFHITPVCSHNNKHLWWRHYCCQMWLQMMGS